VAKEATVAGPVCGPSAAGKHNWWMKLELKQRLARIDRLFLGVVVVPTLLAVVYFGFIASDVYMSESRFVVRSPERQTGTTLGMLLRGASFARAQDDTFTVQEYILSRDALRVLVDRLHVDRSYGKSSVDRLSRFAGIDTDDSFEALHRYYQKMVRVSTDSSSSIATLTVRAFTAEDARAVDELLLHASEALVNRLNERGRQDMIRYAHAEVKDAETKARDAMLAVSVYRNRQGVVDPEKQAAVQLQQVAKMQDELIATTTQLAQLKAFTPGNPQIPQLQKRGSTLQQAIDQEVDKVAGGQRSLANKVAGFQQLALEAEFAGKQLASALASLENARNEAQRQQVYLERIAEPSLPDVAQEPHRLRGIFSTLIVGLVAWGVLGMLFAGIREHHD
jgi:capsular polysaccharide transport system permease protein